MPRQSKKPPVHFCSVLKHLTIPMLYGRLVKESHYLIILHHNLQAVGWQDLRFFPDGFGGNASFLYLLFKILFNEKPQSILELGSGQSTFFTSRYAQENNIPLLILEDDVHWYDRLKNDLSLGPTIRYVLAPLQEITFRRKKRSWYSTSLLQEENTRYHLIVVDGPAGDRRYSRLGLLCYLPKIIDPENFIILFDDSARIGERDTLRCLYKLLRKKQISFAVFHVYGTKRQTCVVSRNYSYMASQWNLF